jgi:hypothetical protein
MFHWALLGNLQQWVRREEITGGRKVAIAYKKCTRLEGARRFGYDGRAVARAAGLKIRAGATTSDNFYK